MGTSQVETLIPRYEALRYAIWANRLYRTDGVESSVESLLRRKEARYGSITEGESQINGAE